MNQIQKIYGFLALFISLFIFHQPLYGQEDTIRSITIFESDVKDILNQQKADEVLQDASVITSGRTVSQKSTQAPATIYTISAEDIERRGYRSLLDVLRDAQWFKVEYAVDVKFFNNITMRGLVGMEKFLLLSDGVRISSPTNDAIPIMENYPIEQAQQIEIVFGSASALYGADAFSGVINIITKTASEPNETSIKASYSRFQNYFGNFYFKNKLSEKVHLSIVGQYNFDQQPLLYKYYPDDYPNMEQTLQTNTFNTIFGPISPQPRVSPEVSQSPIRCDALQMNLKYRNLTFNVFHNDVSFPSITAGLPDNNVYNKDHFLGHSVTMGNILWENKIGKWNFNTYLIASLYQLDPKSNFRNVYTGLNTAYKYAKGDMLKFDQLISYYHSEKWNLVFGFTAEYFYSAPIGHDLQYSNDSENKPNRIINSIYPNNLNGIDADIVKINYNNLGGLIQFNYSWRNAVRFTLGVRYDQNSRFGSTFNPRLGIVWTPTSRISIKALYGSAYLAPSPEIAFRQFGSFYSIDNGTTYKSSFFRLPNPKLKPQILQSFDLSFIWSISDNLRFNMSGFYSTETGIFKLASDAGNTNLYNNKYQGWPVDYIEVSINQGNQSNYGAMLSMDYLKKFDSGFRLGAYFSLNYTDGKVQNTDAVGNTSDAEIPVISPWMFKCGIEPSYRNFSLSVRLNYIGEQRTYTAKLDDINKKQVISDYTLMNVYAYYKFDRSAMFFVQISNALDSRYYNVNLGASPDSDIKGSAQAEVANGMPQSPLRWSMGLKLKL